MAEMRATPRNKLLGWISDQLGSARDVGDKVQLPVLGGAGSMLLGTSPEEINEWSYGSSPMFVPAESNLPQLRSDERGTGLVDTLGAAPLLGAPVKLAQMAARPLARPAVVAALQRTASALGVPDSAATTSNVIKPRGGQWLSGSVEDALRGLKRGNPLAPGSQGIASDAMDDWIDKQLTRYVKTDMATPEDPIRALAERGVLHVDPQNLRQVLDNYVLRGSRADFGYPRDPLAESETAKRWENVSDAATNPVDAGYYIGGEGPHTSHHMERNPWLSKVPPQTPVYFATNRAADDLGFPHLIDELRNAINPESGLPPELLLKYSSLPKVSVPQAVQRVHDINHWRAAQKAEADMALAMNPATHLLKEYPDSGLRWVELKKPSISSGARFEALPSGGFAAYDAAGNRLNHPFGGYNVFKSPEEAEEALSRSASIEPLEKALKYEGDTMGHCVGGYCDDVASGSSRIFSLRDAKGQPHVTIETQPQGWKAAAGNIPDPTGRFGSFSELVNAMRKGNGDFESVASSLAKQHGLQQVPNRILQIKGKQNRAPNPEYLAAVQDFIRTQGPWSDVGDLKNTGMLHFPSPQNISADGGRIEIPAGYYADDDLRKYFDSPGKNQELVDAQIKALRGRFGYAAGGAVVAEDDTFVPDFMEDPQAQADIRQRTADVLGAATDPQFYKDVAGNAARAAFDDGYIKQRAERLMQELGI